MNQRNFHLKKWIGIFAPWLLFVTACSFLPAAPTGPELAELEPGCRENGTVQAQSFNSPTRGYSYSYVVYLPPCFDPATESDSAYPVLYLVPGRGSGPQAWFEAGAASVADELILAGEIPPFIIIGTENIENDPSAAAILTDLIPLVEQAYPLQPSRRYRAVAGGSLGGIAAYRLVFRFPEKFSSAGMFGSGVISGEEAQVRSWLEAIPPESGISVFLDTGANDPLMLERARVLDSILAEKKIPHLLHVGEGGHTYAYWVSNFDDYLRWLAAGWQ